MRRYLLSAGFLCAQAAVAVLCGCATPDVPQPPSLHVPEPVADLHAARAGNQVTLSWTAPAQTTDDENIRRPGVTRICRDLDTTNQCSIIKELPSLAGKPQQYADSLPADMAQRTGLIVYHVEAVSPEGRMDHPSNTVVVPICYTPPAPDSFSLEPSRTGITIRWQGPAPANIASVVPSYRVLRRDPGATQWTPLATVPVTTSTSQGLSYTDPTPEFGHDYEYSIEGFSHLTLAGKDYDVEGDTAPPKTISFRDVFPPAAPAGLQAVYAGIPGQDAIDLSWNPEQERELAGYNVYRHEANGNPTRLNGDVIPGSSYHDANVVPGHKYFYSVTAVDAHGIEGKPSAETSETVPGNHP